MSRLTDEVLSDVEEIISTYLKGLRARRLLDVGCWDGRATSRYASAVGADEALGLEIFPEPATLARAKGVDVRMLDLESERFPFDDQSIDICVCNQVFEHVKNIYLLMDEIHRVLRGGGILVFSVPNLASFHNRIMMSAGLQPTSIRVIGPHVRGFTSRASSAFVEFNGHFQIESAKGAGFYPFPITLGRRFAQVLPSAAHTTIIFARKRESGLPKWGEHMSALGLQTSYCLSEK